jgi:peptidoglycan hydrolase-like protein with peptidoglycan-binding domain
MRSPLLAALVLLVAMALAACGGGGGDKASSTTAADTGIASPIETEAPPETKAAAAKAFQIKVPASAPIGPTSPPKTIKSLQRALKMLGYEVGTPDGIWGANTHKAVVKFQKQHDLEADGLVGLATAKAINKQLKQQT